jgi:hypothetical protein
LQTAVLARLGIQAADAATLTQVKGVLNQVMLEAHSQVELQAASTTLTVAANASTVNLPADLTRIKSLLNATVVMQPITDEMMASDVALVAAGVTVNPSTVPVLYRVRTGATLVLVVWPTPTVSTPLTLDYVQRPALMSGNTDTPGAIPSDFHWYLVEAAAERIGANEEMFAAGQYSGAMAQRLFDALRAWRAKVAGPTQARVKLQVYG